MAKKNQYAPVITSAADASLTENIAPSIIVYDINATDRDPGSKLSYSVTGDDAALFSIDPVTGQMRFLVSPDYETPSDANGDNLYQVIIHATDGLHETIKAVTISVTNANDPVLITSAVSTGSVVGDAATSPSTTDSLTASGTIAFTDQDLGDLHNAGFAPAANQTALGTFSLDAVNEAANAASGSVQWHYVLDNAFTNYPPAGTSVVEHYKVYVDDGHNSTVYQDVAITIWDTQPAAPPPPPPLPPGDGVFHTEFDLFTQPGAVLRGANIVAIYDDNNPGQLYPNGIPQASFDALHAAGANYVNLSVPLPTSVDAPYSWQESLANGIDALIAQAAQADMFVVLSFRTGPGRSNAVLNGDGGHYNDEIWTSATAQDAWANALGQVAERYHNNHTVVGYDVMVEPDNYGAYAQWNALAQKFSDAIRAHDTDTPIIIPSSSYSYPDTLQFLNPTTDAHTVYDVHQYAPYEYTQNLGGAAPSDADIADQYTMIQTFKDNWHVPVIVNEFGMAYDEVPNAAHVLQQNFNQLEAHGLSGALWDWRGAADTWDTFNLRTANATITAEVHDYWALNTVHPSNAGFDYIV